MRQKKENSKGIIEGVIWKQLLLFFFPMLFGTFFQQLYNTADAVVVGRYVGKEALSAVGGTTGTLINLFVGFFVGISTGATVAISQYFGGGKDTEVSKSVHTAMALALLGGTLIMFSGIFFAPMALEWMGTPEEIMPYSLIYIRIFFVGMIPNLIYNMGAGMLRAIGDSRRPLNFLIISCMVNIVLDLLFVAVFGWGVAGAAIATVISQACSAVLVCRVLMRTNESYKLNLRQIRFHNEIMKRIVYIGFPAGLQSLMYTFSNIIIQSSVNGFGTDTIAAWTAYGKIDGIFWMTMNSFGISITTFVGQNFGAGKYGRVRKGIRICMSMAMSTAICMSFLLYFAGFYVFKIFTNDLEVLEKGIRILRFTVPFFFTYVSIEILSGSLRGMGNALMPMLLTCIGVCVLRIVWIFTMVPIKPDILTVISSYPITWTITSVLFIIYYMCFIRKSGIRYMDETKRL